MPNNRSKSSQNPPKRSHNIAESEGVIFIPFTKNSQLKRKMQSAEDNLVKGLKSGRIRVMERVGTSVAKSLANPTPWKKEACGRTTYHTCQTSKGGICKTLGAVYSITCTPCQANGVKSLYLGESHRTIFDRMSEHFGKLKNCQKDSSLAKHWKNFHPDMKIHQNSLSK